MGLSCKEAPSQGVSLLGRQVNWEGNFEGRTADLQPGGESHPVKESRRELQQGGLACARAWNKESLVCPREEGWSVYLCDKGQRGEECPTERRCPRVLLNITVRLSTSSGILFEIDCMKFLVTPFISGRIPVQSVHAETNMLVWNGRERDVYVFR